MAILPNIGIHFLLLVCLLYSLLLDKAYHYRYHLHLVVLWLYAYHGFPILPLDGYSRLFRLLLVCSKNIQCRQGGLSICRKMDRPRPKLPDCECTPFPYPFCIYLFLSNVGIDTFLCLLSNKSCTLQMSILSSARKQYQGNFHNPPTNCFALPILSFNSTRSTTLMHTFHLVRFKKQ